MANIKKIKLPNGTTYDIKDSGALPLTGGTVTGPVIFQDTTSMDEATIGDLVVNGNASFTNNIQANTINGVVVGNNPKFTDTITTATTSGSGNAVTAITASNGVLTVTKGSTFALTSDIPTKTSDLTNDSGFITSYTDEKLKISAATSGSSYYLLLGNGTSAATRQYDTALQFSGTNGTASGTGGNTMLTLGNSTTSSTAGWRRGLIQIYGYGAYATTLQSGTPTAHRTITFPDKTGTVALTSDIPTVPTVAGNSATGISISDHGTTSVGSASGWSAGTASTWAFEEVSIPNVTSAGSASTWAFSSVTVANSIAGAVDSTDSSQLNITLGTTSVQSKSSGSNGTAPTLGTAIKVQSKKSGANSTVPSLTITSTTVVNGKSHSITDNGHTHTI